VQHLLSFLGATSGNVPSAPQFELLLAFCMWIAVVVRLVYLGVLLYVALFSKDHARANRAQAMFRDLLRQFWWRKP
jgi:hypothetical protein